MVGYYLFSVFVFVLCLAVIFIAKMVFKNQKPLDYKEKDEKLLRLYRQIEDMLESLEEFVEEEKQEINNQKLKSLDEIKTFKADIEEQLEKTMETTLNNRTDEIIRRISVSGTLSDKAKRTEKKRNLKEAKENSKSKSDMVKELYVSGLGVNEIAKKLGITSSEINLIIFNNQ